jgi:hypothetical protein
MSEIIEFPFDSGAYEAADRKWLPNEVLAVAENVRLDRDGRLTVRPGATALSLDTMSIRSLVPYDLGNYRGALVALGSQRSSGTGMQDLFEWIGRASKWRATSGDSTSNSSGQRLPTMTDIREVGTIPDQGVSVRHVSLAFGAGYVCAVISRAADSTVHVFDPVTNQTLLLEDVAMRLARVCFAGSDFWITGVDADEDIVGVNFDPLTDETLPGETTLLSNATVVLDLAVSTFGTGWAVAWCTASSALVRTYSSAGASVANWTGVAANTEAVALAGNTTGTLLSLAYQDSSSEYWLTTFNASGAIQNGPTDIFGGAGGSGTRLGMCFNPTGIQNFSNATLTITGTNELNRIGLIVHIQQSTHTPPQGFHIDYYEARPAMAPVSLDSEEFSGWIDNRASDRELGTFHVVGNRQLPQCFLAQQQIDTQTTGSNVVSNGCTDGVSKVYIAFVQMAENTGQGLPSLRAAIYEAETSKLNRRQMAEVGGELLISGGLPLTYDGRTMTDIGFAECPIISFVSEDPAGQLEQLSTYQVKAVWKCYNGKNLVARSQPSPPASHTLTGANESINWIVTTPHSLKRHSVFRDQNLTVVVEVYRTIANGGNFQLDSVTVVDPADASAEPVAVVSDQPDSTLDENLILYSDESGLEVSAPEPFKYIWPARDRAFTGGLPTEDIWFYSDLTIPARQVAFPFSSRLSYQRRHNQPITAVGAFEAVGVVWSKDEIAQVPGRGPERSGTGEFDSMLAVPTPGGCIDWRSLVSTPVGFFFQMAPDKLMLLTRSQQGSSAGDVQWVGQPVRDTLEAFPVITGAVHVRAQMQVAFACNASNGLSGRIIIYDLRRQQWFVDNVGGPIAAIAELDGRLVWLSGGAIFQQDLAPGSGTFVSHAIQTGYIRITKNLGWGHVYRVGLLGVAVGACSVECFIDYDDGAGLRSLGTETFTGSEGTFERLWSLAIQKTSRFSLRWVITNGSPTAALRLNAWAVEVEGSKNMVRVGSTGHVA